MAKASVFLLFLVASIQVGLNAAVKLPITNQERDVFECPSGGYGIYPNPDQLCTSTFYQCEAGIAYIGYCPGNNIFDPESKRCVPYSESSCAVNPSTSTPPGETCPTDNGFYPIPGTCGSSYYTCTSGILYPSTCPGNAIFDPAIHICTTPETASCITFECPETDGFFPLSPGVCSQTYFICIGGVKYITACPNPSSVFDPELQACIVATSCLPQETTTRTTLSTSTQPVTFTCPPENGLYAKPGTCGSEYYNCINQELHVQTCEDGYVFDPVAISCVSSAYAPCNRFECSGPNAGTNGEYPIQTNVCIETYMTCIDGNKFPTACQQGFVFDPVEKKCVLEADSSCKRRFLI